MKNYLWEGILNPENMDYQTAFKIVSQNLMKERTAFYNCTRTKNIYVASLMFNASFEGNPNYPSMPPYVHINLHTGPNAISGTHNLLADAGFTNIAYEKSLIYRQFTYLNMFEPADNFAFMPIIENNGYGKPIGTLQPSEPLTLSLLWGNNDLNVDSGMKNISITATVQILWDERNPFEP